MRVSTVEALYVSSVRLAGAEDTPFLLSTCVCRLVSETAGPYLYQCHEDRRWEGVKTPHVVGA